MLPPFWQFLNHFWIGAAAVNAERGILYFGGQGVGMDMLKLLAWTAVIVGVLLLPRLAKARTQTGTLGRPRSFGRAYGEPRRAILRVQNSRRG